MRKLTFGVANSLDNFIARADGGVDWLRMDEEVAAVSPAYWQTVDALLMGRKTYEVALRFGTTHYPGVKNYVFSRTMKESPDARVEIVAEDAAEFVRRLKNEEGGGICLMGGGEVARSLFAADLIDEVVLNVQPVLLGAGVPLFHDAGRQIDLELLDSKAFKGGNVLLTYRVRH